MRILTHYKMFNFLKKNKSQPAQAAEDVRFDAFKEHWKQVKAVLEATGPWSNGTRNIGKFLIKTILRVL